MKNLAKCPKKCALNLACIHTCMRLCSNSIAPNSLGVGCSSGWQLLKANDVTSPPSSPPTPPFA